MSDDIPEDIRAVAAGCFGRDDIARAILAERERCAKIADARAATVAHVPVCGEGVAECRRRHPQPYWREAVNSVNYIFWLWTVGVLLFGIGWLTGRQ